MPCEMEDFENYAIENLSKFSACISNVSLGLYQLGKINLSLPFDYSPEKKILVGICTFQGEFEIDSSRNWTFNRENMSYPHKWKNFDKFPFISIPCEFAIIKESSQDGNPEQEFTLTGKKPSNKASFISTFVQEEELNSKEKEGK